MSKLWLNGKNHKRAHPSKYHVTVTDGVWFGFGNGRLEGFDEKSQTEKF